MDFQLHVFFRLSDKGRANAWGGEQGTLTRDKVGGKCTGSGITKLKGRLSPPPPPIMLDNRNVQNWVSLSVSSHIFTSVPSASVTDGYRLLTFVTALLFSDFANSHNFMASSLFLKSKYRQNKLGNPL